MNNNPIPPVVQSRLDEIDAALGKITDEKERTAAAAEKMYAHARDLEVQEQNLQAERNGMKKVLEALALSDQLELPTSPPRKPKVMVENRALPLLKAGPMKEQALAETLGLGDDPAFWAWVHRAVNAEKITRSEDGMLEAL